MRLRCASCRDGQFEESRKRRVESRSLLANVSDCQAMVKEMKKNEPLAQFAQDYIWAPTRRQLADPLSKLVAKPLFARFAPRLKGLKPHTEWSSDEDD